MLVLSPHGIVVIGEYTGKTNYPVEGEIILHYFVTAPPENTKPNKNHKISEPFLAEWQ
jgi:hypothetical protein